MNCFILNNLDKLVLPEYVKPPNKREWKRDVTGTDKKGVENPYKDYYMIHSDLDYIKGKPAPICRNRIKDFTLKQQFMYGSSCD